MLKKQPNISSTCICLNPYCTLPYTRTFAASHHHSQMVACKNWILHMGQYSALMRNGHPKQASNLAIDVGRVEGKSMIQNIEALVLASQVDWEQYLGSFKAVFMQRIQKEVQRVFRGIKQKIIGLEAEKIIDSIATLYKDIQKGKKNQSEIRSSIEQIIVKYFNKMVDKTTQIKCPNILLTDLSALFTSINTIEQKLFLQKKRQIPVKINEQKSEEFTKFMLEGTAPFNRLQQISSFCGQRQQNFVVKMRIITLDCAFCKHVTKQKLKGNQVESQLKGIKKKMAEQMIQHLYNVHEYEIFQKFMQKKTKFNNSSEKMSKKQVTFEQFLKDMQSGRYKKLHIIDRQTGLPNSLQNYNDPSCYKIEVLSRTNSAMAKIRHLITPDRKSTQFIINYMAVYAIWVSQWIQMSNLTIQSNCRDINRVSHLVGVLNKSQGKAKQEKKEYTKNQSKFYEQHKSESEEKVSRDQMDYIKREQFGGDNQQSKQSKSNFQSERKNDYQAESELQNSSKQKN